ncbi:MAG: oxidoreductase [Motiliproteus sp.]|nr:oxidoreductase [Motiliproteus sp.]MCW9051020.1 oxidoreductase [Motiliproteus sp.]
MFKALVLEQEEKKTIAEVRQLQVSDLPDEDVLIAVDYSSLNYKDGLAVTGTGKIIRDFPMVPGIDLTGKVLESRSDEFKPGDAVVMTGWSVGERFWGGYSQQAKMKSNWLVPLPDGLTGQQAMAIGTAGLTSMLCIMALEEGGITPDSGEILVTGAAGGVGSVAVALLSRLGYKVAAVTGRESSHDYLRKLGATTLVTREEMSEKCRPLEAQRWAGGIDTVGDSTLARLLSEVDYGGVVAACGLAGGVGLPTTVMPFILRNVRLQGVDSVMCPKPRRIEAWKRLSELLPESFYAEASQVVSLEQVPEMAQKIIAGQVQGRTIVDPNL